MRSCDIRCDFPCYRLKQVSPLEGYGSNTNREGVEVFLDPRS